MRENTKTTRELAFNWDYGNKLRSGAFVPALPYRVLSRDTRITHSRSLCVFTREFG